MSVAMVQVSKVCRHTDGALTVKFYRVDSITKRPAGEQYESSRIVGIEVVKDAYGAIHHGKEACMILRTESNSVYFAVLDKRIANVIAKILQAKPTKKIG